MSSIRSNKLSFSDDPLLKLFKSDQSENDRIYPLEQRNLLPINNYILENQIEVHNAVETNLNSIKGNKDTTSDMMIVQEGNSRSKKRPLQNLI